MALLVACVDPVSTPSGPADGGSSLDGTVAASSIAFVQQATAPSAAGTMGTVKFPSNVKAHDAIIVCVGFAAGTETVSGISDTLGHTYDPVAGPFDGNGARHYIYLASDTSAGADTLTVTLNGSVSNLDIQAHEYAGLARSTAFDVAASGNGTSNAPNGMASGSATTSAGNELIFGYADANMVKAGTGFTERTSISGNVTEDKVVSVAGAYQATATMTAGNGWTMMMATFRGQ